GKLEIVRRQVVDLGLIVLESQGSNWLYIQIVLIAPAIPLIVGIAQTKSNIRTASKLIGCLGVQRTRLDICIHYRIPRAKSPENRRYNSDLVFVGLFIEIVNTRCQFQPVIHE